MCFQTVAWLGLAAAGTVPAPLPRGVLAVHPSAPCGVKAAQVVIPCPPVLPVLHVTWGGSWTPPERSQVGCFSSSFQQGLTQPLVLFGAGSAAPRHLVMVWGTPSLTPALRGQRQCWHNGPLGLLAAGLVLGLHRDRDTDLQLSGGCWGVKEQSMATLAVLMTWFEMRILHLSGFPLYF